MLKPRTPITWANLRWAYGELWYGIKADYWINLFCLAPIPGSRLWKHIADLRRDTLDGKLTVS